MHMYIVIVVLFFVFGSRFLEFMTADAVNEMFAAGMTVRQFYVFLALVLVVTVITVHAVRIAGQYVFGRLAGFRFGLLQIGRCVLVKKEDGYRLCKYRSVFVPGLYMIAPEGVSRIKWAMALMGGIPALLAAAAVFLLLSRVSGAAAEFILVFIALLSSFSAVCEAIPMRLRGGNTAGKEVIRFFKNERALEVFSRNNKVAALGISGIRVKDMPEELFVCEGQTDTDAAVLNAIYAQHLMDRGEYMQAKEKLRCVVNTGVLPPYETGALICDAIMCEAAGECDMDKIRKMLSPALRKHMKKNADMPYVLRTCYIEELLLNKNADAAQKVRERFEKVAADYLKSGVIESCRENFAIIDNKAKEIA